MILTCALENGIRHLASFDPALEGLKMFTLMSSFDKSI